MIRLIATIVLFGTFVVFPIDCAFGDVVVPSDRVSVGVNVRENPNASSLILDVLTPGEQLEYVGSVPGWHEVILDDGRHGFVSKSWTVVRASGTAEGSVTIDVVDVGTGLAILVRGNQFALIYDGGSNDDLARGESNRFLSFLRSQHPDLQTIDHLILSHPHRDHVELLPDIIANYQVRHFWDSGAVNDICGYRAFIEAISQEAQAVYHSALFNFGNHPVNFAAKTCYGQDLLAANISLPHGSKINHDPIMLAPGVSMKILHADGSKHGGFNENSIVMRLDFGQNRILFMGDAEAGGRADPETPPVGHSIEGILLACCLSELRVNVLIVGHHGSKTSSRAAFLNAVGAKQFVISSGPMKYGKVVLPDGAIVQEMEKRGTLFRTDLNDQTCGQNQSKIGPDNDGRAGGCDNVRIVLPSNGQPAITYFRPAD
jgi:beta-lactamase superfamily II metal-dependent hydrolase